MSSLKDDLKAAWHLALPVALGYVAIGLPCGIMESQAGLTWWEALLLSATFYSGAGQFMMSSMAISGSSLPSMIGSVSLVSSRQVLYSASFSQYFSDVSKPLAALFSATVTDESFGVNLEAFETDPTWTPKKATIVNLMCMSSWAFSNAIGCAIGPIIDLPVDVMSFAMTAIFICLLVGQKWNSTTIVVVIGAVVGVYVCKLIGLSGVAVLLGSIVGILAGLAKEAIFK